jgi:predicted GNAT family acetyltransferase
MVRDNSALSRFELDTDGAIAFAKYERNGEVVSIIHTETPAALRGRGIGSQLIEGVMTLLRQQHLKVRPLCGFARRFVAQHPEYRDLVV